MNVVKIREREYLAALDKMLDDVYLEVSDRNWSWAEFARRADLSTSTVYHIGNRVTRQPRFSTVWKLVRVVGGSLELKLNRIRAKAVKA